MGDAGNRIACHFAKEFPLYRFFMYRLFYAAGRKELHAEAMGWDTETGIPTRETLEKFDLGDMADKLAELGLIK